MMIVTPSRMWIADRTRRSARLEFLGRVADLRRELVPKWRVVAQLVLGIADPSVDQFPHDVSMPSVLRCLSNHPDQQHIKSGIRVRPPRHMSGAIEIKLSDSRIGMGTSSPVKSDHVLTGFAWFGLHISTLTDRPILHPRQPLRNRMTQEIPEIAVLQTGEVLDQPQQVRSCWR